MSTVKLTLHASKLGTGERPRPYILHVYSDELEQSIKDLPKTYEDITDVRVNKIPINKLGY
jgi:hypothetical protein